MRSFAASDDKSGQKKPELLQARVESTMEAVEETIGAIQGPGQEHEALLNCVQPV
jgi:hypothetical protein